MFISKTAAVVALTGSANLLNSMADAFAPYQTVSFATCRTSSLPVSMSSQPASGAAPKDVVVISPPGGVGEITAVEAARLGGSVRWFVVSAKEGGASRVALTGDTLADIEAAGGSVELAGADAPSLLLPRDEAGSAVPAVGAWCKTLSSGDAAVVCTTDGAKEEQRAAERLRAMDERGGNEERIVTEAVRVAAREAVRTAAGRGRGLRLAVLPADQEMEGDEETSKEEGGGFLGNLLGGGKETIPSSLTAALGDDGAAKVAILRHGELFGVPDSSPESSPFLGGPRRDPILRDEYTTRTIRIDPTVSVSGNVLSSGATRSSRLAVGEAAARMALSAVPVTDGADLCLSSFAGTDAPTAEEWNAEFERVQEMLTSGGGAQLFQADFASVPSTERLAEWLATKWAPAILRTYDIAGIRVGERPVFASRVGEDTVEIVWQKLIDFNTVTVGRMIIEVSDTEIVAARGPGDSGDGYGSVSLKPLNGEDILVRRLADAVSQAIEKGLATKPVVAKKPKKKSVKKVEPVAPATTVVSSTTVGTTSTGAETGPRSAGARRSSERTRGKRRKSPPVTEEKKSEWQ